MLFIKTFESFHLEEFIKLVKFNKTYIRKHRIPETVLDDNYIKIRNKIRNYDINNFIFDIKPYGITIYPDQNFKDIINELNDTIENNISTEVEFNLSIDNEYLNQIEFGEGIPNVLRGLSLSYKIYKILVERFDYITTNKHSSILAYNLWYNLMMDSVLYCYTSNFCSGIISKNISDEQLIIFLNKIKKMDLIFDPELENKIIELYGSMDIYKQGNY